MEASPDAFMNKHLNNRLRAPTTSGPKYSYVYQHLLAQVREGVFKVGAPLPKEEELAKSLEVARSTVRRALAELESDGLIRRIPGKGTFLNSREERYAYSRTNLFSLTVPYLREDPIPTLIAGVERAASEMQYRVVISATENDVKRQEDLLREVVEHNTAGVILLPSTETGNARQIASLRERHVPIVFCSRRIPRVEAPLVTWPRADVGYLVAETLLDHGHGRIASLCSFEDIFTATVAFAIRQTLKEHGTSDSDCRLLCYGERQRGKYAHEAIARALKEVLFREKRPTALQCFSSFDAEQVYLVATDLGFRIPEDLSLVYFGSKERETPLSRRIVCVGVDTHEIGWRACRILHEIIVGKTPYNSNVTHEVPLELLEGETIAPPSPDAFD